MSSTPFNEIYSTICQLAIELLYEHSQFTVALAIYLLALIIAGRILLIYISVILYFLVARYSDFQVVSLWLALIVENNIKYITLYTFKTLNTQLKTLRDIKKQLFMSVCLFAAANEFQISCSWWHYIQKNAFIVVWFLKMLESLNPDNFMLWLIIALKLLC